MDAHPLSQLDPDPATGVRWGRELKGIERDLESAAPWRTQDNAGARVARSAGAPCRSPARRAVRSPHGVSATAPGTATTCSCWPPSKHPKPRREGSGPVRTDRISRPQTGSPRCRSRDRAFVAATRSVRAPGQELSLRRGRMWRPGQELSLRRGQIRTPTALARQARLTQARSPASQMDRNRSGRSAVPGHGTPGALLAAGTPHPVSVAPTRDPDGAGEPAQAQVGEVDPAAGLARGTGDDDGSRLRGSAGVQRLFALSRVAGPDGVACGTHRRLEQSPAPLRIE